MRRMSIFLAITLLLAMAFTVLASADADKKAVVSYGTAVVDGEIDDVWKNVEGYKTTNIYQDGERATDTVSEWKIMWDESNMYFLIVVTDSEVNSQNETFWQNDCTQLFIDFANSSDFDLYDYNGMGDALGVRFNVPGIIELPESFRIELLGGGGYLFPEDSELKDARYAYKKTSTGYIMEYSFDPRIFCPSFKLQAGSKGGVDFINDDSKADSTVRDVLYHWSVDGDTWSNPVNLSVFELAAKVEAPVAPPAEETVTPADSEPPVTEPAQQDPVTAAPATGDISFVGIVFAMIFSCFLAVTLKTKKIISKMKNPIRPKTIRFIYD